MFFIFLRFSRNKAAAKDFMAAHNAWIAKGFDDGVFLAAGSLHPSAGGAILAHNCSREALEARVNEDPFVAEDIVSPEIQEMSPARTDPRMDFLRA